MPLTPFGTMVVECVFKDREREAEFRLRFPFSTSFENAATAAQTIADAAQAISNALLVRITIRKLYSDYAGIQAPEGSRTTRRMMLYYSNEEDFEALSIPSGNTDLLETTGQYAGIRLDTTLSSVADALGLLSLALVDARTPENAPFPTDFLVGGIAK